MKAIILSFILPFVFFGCQSVNIDDRINDDEWVLLDTIGIVYLTVWPDVKHRTDEQIEIVDYKSTGVAWLVNKQLKDNPYFPRIELDEDGLHGEPSLSCTFNEEGAIESLYMRLPERLFNTPTIIKLYDYAVSIYDSLKYVKREKLRGDKLFREAGIE